MESPSSPPGSPTPGGPLGPISPDRANRDSSIMASLHGGMRESPVHDKISQFNTLSMQTKSLERQTADAALKRAMLGREQAEGEMRRFRDENKILRVQLDKAKDREQRVSERLETVMEQYGRAKETFAHTKTAWEKEIKQARKKTFKNDATIIRLQEEVKSARDGWRAASDTIDNERARNKAREQEAFEARYSMVGLEEKLEAANERIKVLEQERDAFKTLAKEEEVARIAAEGRIPLPRAQDQSDEFASPRKKQRTSLTTAQVVSSSSSEEEVEELTRQVQWERQRAQRAHEYIDFLKAECHLRSCDASRHLKRQSILSPRRVLVAPQEITAPSDLAILGQAPTSPASASVSAESGHSGRPSSRDSQTAPANQEQPLGSRSSRKRSRNGEMRRSTIFCQREGIFRTVSQEEAEAHEAAKKQNDQSVEAKRELNTEQGQEHDQDLGDDHERVEEDLEEEEEEEEEEEMERSEELEHSEPPTPVQPSRSPRMYARTPSVDPPTFALMAQERVSLASLLNAPHGDSHPAPLPDFVIPTIKDEVELSSAQHEHEHEHGHDHEQEQERDEQDNDVNDMDNDFADDINAPQQGLSPPSPTDLSDRPHTTAGFYKTSTTTTTIPIHDEIEGHHSVSSRFERARTPSTGDGHASFDVNNPAMTPTCSREEALARIRERRGRARSAAQGAATPRKQMVEGAGERRDLSAPVGAAAKRTSSTKKTTAAASASRFRKAR